MNSDLHNPTASESVPVAVSGFISSSAEKTLRLIASLPAPAGLEDRVHAALRSAPHRGPQREVFVAGVASWGRVLAWPKSLKPQNDWLRTAAAATIVFVVAGGGWGVYTHVQNVQQSQPAKVIVVPRGLQPAGFSGAGAMRTPQTLPGPTVILPVKKQPSPSKGTKKPAAPCADQGWKRSDRAGSHACCTTRRFPIRRRSLLLVLHDRPDQHAQQSQHYRAPEGGTQTVYMEPRNKARCHQDHDAVDDQQEDAQREDGEREGDDLEEQSHCGVKQPDDQRGYEGRNQARHVESGHEMGNNEERDRAQDPMKKQSHGQVLQQSGSGNEMLGAWRRRIAACSVYRMMPGRSAQAPIVDFCMN